MSNISTDILIIGAGPAGLSCAKVLAERGRQVLLLERQEEIGPKVCAGGVTWNGLLQLVPEEFVEKRFQDQYIYTVCQRAVVRERKPVIATVSRRTLGQVMMHQALQAGAEILTGTKVTAIDGLHVTAVQKGSTKKIRCSQLVGADGANSLVRRSLGIPMVDRGPGINFQIPGDYDRMEWHLHTKTFGCGYAWIFPHKNTVSIGAYTPQGEVSVGRLKRNLLRWARNLGFQLDELYCQAALINYDYRGHSFGPVWLIGDAAGLASGLTGEGIYPAVVSGQAVARQIVDPCSDSKDLSVLLRRHRQHLRLVRLSQGGAACSFILMEVLALLLRSRILTFKAFEMASVPHGLNTKEKGR
ncbi:MAG: NAD(P)/FAD-dependent oxidoreductase [Candidatus Electrothrix sp. AUS4]|nr:NAD(P)/FAD-dependent oxidoreductase [Candidatus Electrothrix sp. AUS4]